MDTIKLMIRLIIGTISDIWLICVGIIWTIIGYPLLWLFSWILVFFDTCKKETFTRNLQVIGKKYSRNIRVYNVYVKYRGKQYCLNDKKLYENTNVGDEILAQICIDGKGEVKSIKVM